MPVKAQLRSVAVHLLTPLLMCLGMGLAYLGAFHQPQPNHLQVAIVGTDPQAKVLAQSLKDSAGSALDVITVPDRDAAVDRIGRLDLAGAFVPDAQQPELVVNKAASEATEAAVETVFHEVTAQQNVPLRVTDLANLPAGDPTGQSLFFLMIMLSIGGYASVAVIGAAGAGLPMRIRALIGLATSFVVSVIAIAVAVPVYHIIDHDYLQIWALGWLYAAGILAIGIGLHTFLQRWTTLSLMGLFVMLNFTSAGGVYRPELLNGFFGSLHSFWNGAGFLEGARSLLYFGGTGFGGRLASLVVWLFVGLVVLAVAAAAERRGTGAHHHTGPAPAPKPLPDNAVSEAEAETEMAEAVGV
ncbi:hypothetical protein [Nocardia stercoris]|uniref:ABC transporter permease n=1 Tax=Nocardia stercoris TaxID=2483361 RepID=A0A3M2KU15_9NOCA|nr:hypothetical protein [Nocardia stercoris]RMI29137.1 hypothetical protein EBN03_27320 [Nocardia stercoris]